MALSIELAPLFRAILTKTLDYAGVEKSEEECNEIYEKLTKDEDVRKAAKEILVVS